MKFTVEGDTENLKISNLTDRSNGIDYNNPSNTTQVEVRNQNENPGQSPLEEANTINTTDMDMKQKKFLKKAFNHLWDRVCSLKTIYTINNEEKAFRTAEFFLNPVPKDDYPDYYEKIKNPICLKDMKDKQENGLYTDLDDIYDDYRTLITNAQTYNPEGTMAHTDASIIWVMITFFFVFFLILSFRNNIFFFVKGTVQKK